MRRTSPKGPPSVPRDSGAKHLVVIRGYVGSGKSSLAESIASGGTIISLDSFLVGDHTPDIFRNGVARRASRQLLGRLREVICTGERRIIVDTIGCTRYEIRELLDIAKPHGYILEILEPSVSWARNPRQCNQCTRYPLTDESWRYLIINWELVTSVQQVEDSLSPSERMILVQRLTASDRLELIKDAQDGERYFAERSLCENDYLIRIGFTAPSSSDDAKATKGEKNEKRKPGQRKPHNDPVGTDHLTPGKDLAA